MAIESTACSQVANPASDICQIQMWEVVDSREQVYTPRGETWILRFVVRGTLDECVVQARVDDLQFGIPIYVHQQRLKERTIRNIGFDLWQIEAVYGYHGVDRIEEDALIPKKVPTNILYSTQGGSAHYTHAIHRISQSLNAPDHNLAIGASDGKIAGLDRPASQPIWNETWIMSRTQIFERPGPIYSPTTLIDPIFYNSDHWVLNNLSLAERWELMVGYVHGYDSYLTDPNPATGMEAVSWRGFEQGSAQFLGAQIRPVDDNNFEVTFEIARAANAWQNLPSTIDMTGAEITPPESLGAIIPRGTIRANPVPVYNERFPYQLWVYGFDYLQFYHLQKDEDPGDGEGETVVSVPKHYEVLQVSPYVPFNYLGVPMHDMGPGFTSPCALSPIGETPYGYEALVCRARDESSDNAVYPQNKVLLLDDQ